MFWGGWTGIAFQSGGAVLGFKKAIGLGKNVPGAFNSAKHGIKVMGNAEFWISKGREAKDAAYHIKQNIDGIEYKKGCKVCES